MSSSLHSEAENRNWSTREMPVLGLTWNKPGRGGLFVRISIEDVDVVSPLEGWKVRVKDR